MAESKSMKSGSLHSIGSPRGSYASKTECPMDAPMERDEMIELYKNLSNERKQLQMKNNILHKRLAEYYKKRKFDHVLKPYDGQMDVEEKYNQKLFAYEELKEKGENDVADIKAKVNTVQNEYNFQLATAEKKFDALQAHEKDIGIGLIYSKKGRPMSDKTVLRCLLLQRQKLDQESSMYLRYLRVRNAVAELESVVKKLEKIGPGLYVAQYEQLRVERINYANKLEEREDELIKNRTRCTMHNQILAHIREKMHHTDEIIDIHECDLGDAEMEFQRAREDLSIVKGNRNKIRWSLEVERRKAGLLTRRDLLHDYQDATDLVVKLREKKSRLETSIAEMNHKIREARKCEKLQQDFDSDSFDLFS